MKKKILIAISYVLILALGVVGTLAYLTDRDAKVNVFTSGDVEIELSETFEQGVELMPGKAITKKPIITNTGDNAAYVWMTLSVPAALEGVIEWNEGLVADKTLTDFIEGYNTYVFLFEEELAPGEETPESLTQVTLNKNVDFKDGVYYQIVDGNATKIDYDLDDTVLYVNAYAIQSETFRNVEDAYEAYVGQWSKLNGDHATVVRTADDLAEALTKGGSVALGADIEFDADNTITIPAGVTTTLNMNGFDIAAESDGVRNRELLLVKGNLTITGNGTISMFHTGDDMGINYMTTVADVTAGGVLNLEDGVVLDNNGGSYMAFAVHMNNWGEVTLNMKNATLESSYIALRLFNSGYDMNNVNIEDSSLIAPKGALWVHNYIGDLDSNKHSDEAIKSRLNINIDEDTTLIGKVFYGFSEYYYPDDITVSDTVAVNNAGALAEAAKDGKDVILSTDVTAPLSQNAIYGTPVAVIQNNGGVIDGNGNSLDIENPQYNGYAIETYGGTIQNLTIDTAVGRGIVISSPKEDIYINNVVIDGPGYAINTTEHNAKNLVVTDSTIKGWTSLAGLNSVSFTNCLLGENTTKYWQNMGYDQDYDRLVKPYVDATFTNCEFEKGSYIDLSSLGADCTVTLTDCVCNGVEITANNYADYITIELPSGRTLADCVIFK